MVAILVAAGFILHHEVEAIDVATVRATMMEVPWPLLLAAAGHVAVAYLMLVTYDYLSIRLLTKSIPFRQVAPTAFVAFSFSNNLGFAVVTGGSLRYRGYRPLGFTAGDVAVVTLYSHVCFFVGGGAILAAAALGDGGALAQALGLPVVVVWGAGAAAAVAIAAYLVLAARVGRPVKLWRFNLPIPRLPIALGQLAASTVDVLVSAGALYLLVPQPFPLDFLTFAAVTIAAIGAGAASHVPGGIGVVEAVLLFSVPVEAKAELLAAILMFRLLYYFAPLAIATTLILIDMASSGRTFLSRARPPG
ncbi:lysylphosphatidylglycerol synthase domain-containing protein [Lutibaculum baratangense]|nr:lysylphosphatidylglycerol synthase domain-containing protein [Lutibaculum baratangense]